MAAKISSVWWGLAAGLWLVLLAGPAVAHPILQNPIWIEVAPDRMKVKLYVSMRELNVVQGLPIAADGAVDIAEAEESAPRHSGYVMDHLNFRADGVPLQGKVIGIQPPKHVGKGVEGPDRAHFIYRLEYPLTMPPALITFSHTMVKEFPSAPGVPWDLSYAYRFGPVDATPTGFGAVPRDTEVSYQTGFVPAAGAPPPAAVGKPDHALLIQLALLGAALGLGAASRAVLGRTLAGVGLAWLAGWGLGWVFAWKMPGFLAAALGGIGILLASVDNIHRGWGPPQVRRWILVLVFPAAGGLAAWSLPGVPTLAASGLVGRCLLALLGGCLLGGGLTLCCGPRLPAEGTGAKSGFLQLVSLLICLGGLAVLFDGLGLRPWAYWMERFGG